MGQIQEDLRQSLTVCWFLWKRVTVSRPLSLCRFGDTRGYVLYPQIGDRLDLICPASVPGDPHAPPEYEFYKLYLVRTREQADRCEVTDEPNLLLTCDKPHSNTRFTIKFQEFSPNLWGHEFHTHRDYYIIATSDGTRQGLDSRRGGACVTRGMKVVLKVGQSPVGNATHPGSVGGAEGGARPFFSNMVLIGGGVGGVAFLLLVGAVVCGLCYCCRRPKPTASRHPPITLSSLRGGAAGGGAAMGGVGGTAGGGAASGGAVGGASNNSGSEPSDIIFPLRTSDSAYCPHYEKVSGDYGHPVYIVQEMPPQNPANVYYKV
ncbi:ephrin-B3-like [Anguilla rostrata]|uniref:ephrin-B3-like n=1 Tax=Anguilla rostrata TaxID=7938 RepID=UPI0030D6046A